MAPAEAAEAPVLLDLRLDERSGRFTALVAATRTSPLEEQIKVVGRVIRTESIPVPARAIGAGEIIVEADLDWRTLRTDRLGQDPVVSADAIIGKSARRALKPGAPVRGGDLSMPLVVEKGAPVAIIYRVPGMHLTMQGRALEDGARGQSIRVQNPTSKVILFGTVTAAGTVEVTPMAGPGEFARDASEGGTQ
jgi:flagella basal body P-ring formation protein FlgA